MLLTMAVLEASQEHALHVRQALEEMIAEASKEDPGLLRYELYESEDLPDTFIVQRDVDAVDERLHSAVTERLMELGTALREGYARRF